MIRRIADTLVSALLALMLAVLVWVIANQEKDPSMTDTLPWTLTIVRVNEPTNAIVYSQSAAAVKVTLRAPQSLWGQLSPEQFKAEIDLAGQPFGQLALPVRVRATNPAVQIVRPEPATVDLQIELSTEQSVPVQIINTGEPALGYAARPLTANPPQVTVRGPASFVNRVARVAGSLSLQGARDNIDQTVRLTALDTDNNPVGFVTLAPETVQAHVDIQHLGGFRDLAVKVNVRGQVAPGYRISNVTVSPPIVTVFGSTQAIDNSPGFVETTPISVTNAQDDIVERVPLNVPGGLSLLGDPAVQVRVQVEAIQGGLTIQLPMTVQGLREGLEAKMGPETIELILTGPLPKLQSLRPEDVRAVIDLGNLGSGTYQLKPQTIVPQGIVVETILPATIQVTIGTKGTLNLSPVPTPTPPVTPGPTPTRPKG
jgi:YbbR domain-containing protein